MTKQQTNVLHKDGNVVVIGRSGTGKTLLSILRLYAIENINKTLKAEQVISSKQCKEKCVYQLLDKYIAEKNVFLTASPFLIEEIIRQYEDLSDSIKR